ncbi:lipopolysaccharide kinase [Aquimarina sp. ERC-38]|uniref:lipopolysaccharide kinase InaA family protein n=1 Tax=Aquimarina sp. ERC-38 TaxID=2949996 RepID=UPI0022486BBC|nr:lipopolysaccharide kinase InaA family protein [Aquimarina sp. ERC-38]UZO80483.1 lipopolysaccharide kinase [Aquimarina sp. ERC-38]
MKEHFIIHPDYEIFRNDITSCIVNFSKDGKLISDGDRNEIKTFHIGNLTITIKKFKKPNFINSWIYSVFRPSKAKRSYEYAVKLDSLGIDTPQAIAYIESYDPLLKDSYYICKYIDYDYDFRVLVHNRLLKNRDLILQQFAEFTFKMHEAQINFLDHSPGNTLIVKKSEKKYNFYLIDLNRMRFEVMDFKKRMKNFRKLWISRHMVSVIANQYAKLYQKPFAEVYTTMQRFSKTFQDKRNLKTRRRRK